MTWHTLIRISPLNTETGSRVTLRFASANLRTITGLNGSKWVPALTEPPETSIRLFDGGFESPVAPGNARIPINLARARDHFPDIDQYYWPGAEVLIYIGRESDAWPWTLHFTGHVSSHGREQDVLGITCEVDTDSFRKDVLTATYSGGGGAEGGPDLKDRVKPLAIGRPRNVEPVLINVVNSVYQFSAYGAIEAVDALYERAADFGAAAADYADYTALVAATIPPGSWATCLAQGMVRLGAPAFGVITGDVRGHAVGGSSPRLTGAIISALAGLASISEGINTTSLAAMDTAAPYNASLYLDSQVTFYEIARRLALPCNHQAGVSLVGNFFVTRIAIGAAADIVLQAQGRAKPQVMKAAELPVSPPYSMTRLGAERNWRVQTTDEIATGYLLRGVYEETASYRRNDVVTGPDGALWAYINAAASVGQALPVWPATANAYWENFAPPPATVGGVPVDDVADETLRAATIIYTDTPVVSLFENNPGNFGPLVIGHTVQRYGVALEGGAWSLVDHNLGLGTATINATTGDVTLEDVDESGAYIIRYTEASGLTIDRRIPVTFYAAVSITPDNPVITIVENGPGSTSTLVVDHDAIWNGAAVTTGTWSLPTVSLGTGSASINSSTGAVSIGGVDTTGFYVVRLTWSGSVTDLRVPVIYSLEAGEAGIALVVTNDSDIIATEADGTGGDFTAAGGTMTLYRGASPVAAVYSVVKENFADRNWITINSVTGVYTVVDDFVATAPGAGRRARATLIATFEGVAYERLYKLSTIPSPDFDALRVNADAFTMTFNGAGSPAPTSQTITFESFYDGAASLVWTAERFNAAGSSLGTITLGGSGSTRTLTVSQFNANTNTSYVVVTVATDPAGQVEKLTIVRLTDGAAGAAGLSGFLTNEAHVVAVAAGGSYSLLTAGGQFKVFSGGTDVTASATFAVVGGSASGGISSRTSSGLKMEIDTGGAGAGEFALSDNPAWTNQGQTFTLRATYAGATIDRIYSISKSTEGAAGDDGLNNATVTLYRRNATLPTKPSTTSTYTFATGVLTGQNNSWTQGVPASDGNPLWITAAVASATTATDTIAGSEWTTPVILVQNGDPGAAGLDGVAGFLTNEAVTLQAYANGEVVSYTGATGEFKIFSGDTDVSANFTLSSPSNPQALTGPYAGSALFSGRTYSVTGGLDAGEDTASLTIRATGSGDFAGVTLDKVFTLSKAKGGYEIVASLPVTNLFEGRTVFLTTDDKLYRYTGSAWTAAVPATDITGQLTDAQIAAVAAAKVSGQLTNAQLADIASTKITGQLTDAQIAAVAAAKVTGTITTTQIADDAITTPKLVAGAVTASEIAAGAVVAGRIAANAVTATEIASGSITTAKIAAGAVTAGEIAAAAITTAKLAAGAVTAAEIAAGAIVADKIAVNAVTAAKIDAGAVTTAKLAASAVTADTIAVGAVTAAKLATTELITLSAQIGDAVITNAKIASLDASKITTGLLTAGQIDVNGVISAASGTFSGSLDVGGKAVFRGVTTDLSATYPSTVQIDGNSQAVGVYIRGNATTENSLFILHNTSSVSFPGNLAAAYIGLSRAAPSIMARNDHPTGDVAAVAGLFSSANGPGIRTAGGTGYADIEVGKQGTVAAPVITLAADRDTGLFFPAADSLGIATGGAERLRITSTSALLGLDGTAAAPVISRITDTNTGLYFSAADTLDVSAGGTQALSVTATQVLARSTTSTTPHFSFLGDTDTGIAHNSANQMAFYCGGTLIFGLSTGGLTLLQPLRLASGNVPATAGATGIAGQTAYDSNYFYICVAANTWKRAALSTW